MTPLSKEHFQFGMGNFVRLPTQTGQDQFLTIVGVDENTDISDPKKFSVKDKQGNSLGWNYRFRIEDGRVWDISKLALYAPLLEWGLPNGLEKPFVKFKVKLFRKAEKKSTRESYYAVERVNA